MSIVSLEIKHEDARTQVRVLTRVATRSKSWNFSMDSEAYEILQGTIEYSATIKRYRKSLKDLFLHHALACKEDTFSFRLRRRDGDLSLRERERRAEARRHQMYGGVEYISRGTWCSSAKREGISVSL